MKVPVAAAKQAPVPGFGVLTLHAITGRLKVLRPDGVTLDLEHTGRRGVAGGYASLDSAALVPFAQLGSGTATGSKFLRDDRTWQVPPGGGGGAPTDAQYLTLATNATLTDERTLSLALPLSGSDGGAGAAYTVSLSGWSGTTDGDMLYRNGTAVGTKTPAQARTWLDLATYYQPLTANLTAIGGLTSAADKLPYFTGAGTAAVTTFTGFARTLLDDADASAARTTLDAEQKKKLTDGASTTRTIATLVDGEFLKVSGSSIVSAAIQVAAFIALTDGFDQAPDESAYLAPHGLFSSDGSDT